MIITKTFQVLVVVSVAFISLLVISPTMAHHSFAMFNGSETLVLEGTVTKFRWGNPHVSIGLDVKQKDETIKHYSIEGSSPTILKRFGWNFKDIKDGDQITVEMHPLRDGRAGGALKSVTLADGRILTGALPPGGLSNSKGGKKETASVEPGTNKFDTGSKTIEVNNKKTVTAFWNVIHNGTFEQARQYLGETYVEHDPYAKDGHEGVRAMIKFLRTNRPGAHSVIKTILGQGDYVTMLSHDIEYADDDSDKPEGYRGWASISIWRLDEGKIVEHWVIPTEVLDPADTANDNTQF